MSNKASNHQERCGDGSDDWSDGQRGLGGGPAAGQAAFDVPHSEHDPQVEPERNPGGLRADERDTSSSGDHEQATLFEPPASEHRDDEQRGLESGYGPVDLGFGEYGPAMDEPLPHDEQWNCVIPGTDRIDQRELPGTGLAPGDFEVLSGAMSPRSAANLGYHPDDEHRPKKHDDHKAAMARAYALEQVARPRMPRRGER